MHESLVRGLREILKGKTLPGQTYLDYSWIGEGLQQRLVIGFQIIGLYVKLDIWILEL